MALELPDALARQVELVADRLERPRLALEAEPQLEDPPLPLGQRVESSGTIAVPPSLKPTRLLKIWSVTRSDGPSETSDGSSRAGSVSVPKTIVVLAEAP